MVKENIKENIEVVWPLGKVPKTQHALAPRLDTLDGKTICSLFDGVFRFDETWPIIKDLLAKKYPGVKFVDWDKFGVFIGKKELGLHEALASKLRQFGCDAVISGRGC